MSVKTATAAAGRGISLEEIEKFRQLQRHWWNPNGPLRALHLFNPVRTQFICDAVRNFYVPAATTAAASHASSSVGLSRDLSLLDVGCGGGILSESLARLGATVTGVDACEESIHVAQSRLDSLLAEDGGCPAVAPQLKDRLAYRHVSLFDIVEKENKRYDVVVASEVIEHVSDARGFLQALCEATNPGGLLILTTMDKTWKTALTHIGLAEYVTGLVDPGTHDWTKFVPPKDMTTFAAKHQVRNVDLQYILSYPDVWQTIASKNFQINFSVSKTVNTGHYFWVGVKGSAPLRSSTSTPIV